MKKDEGFAARFSAERRRRRCGCRCGNGRCYRADLVAWLTATFK